MMALHFLRQCPLQSTAVNQLSMAAENFIYRLTNVVDRYGCYEANVHLLRAFLYPLKVDEVKPDDISTWLTECVNAGLIILYEVNGQPYLELQGYKCRSGKIKTIIPQRRPVAEVAEETGKVEQSAESTSTPPEKPKPQPGKEHEFYLNELFKREHFKYLDSICHLIREPILERRWVEAFNEHLKNTGRRYTVDHEWLDALKAWLPQNIQQLLRKDGVQKPVYKPRPRPMVL